MCCVCNKVVDCWDDDDPQIVGLVQCKNGHTFCPEHSKNKEKIFELVGKANKKYETLYIDPSLCPVCNMEVVCASDAFAYIIKNQDKEYVKEEIKGRFKTYDEFQEYLNEDYKY
jgi:uncharacterized protein with PIN domain